MYKRKGSNEKAQLKCLMYYHNSGKLRKKRKIFPISAFIISPLKEMHSIVSGEPSDLKIFTLTLQSTNTRDQHSRSYLIQIKMKLLYYENSKIDDCLIRALFFFLFFYFLFIFFFFQNWQCSIDSAMRWFKISADMYWLIIHQHQSKVQGILLWHMN